MMGAAVTDNGFGYHLTNFTIAPLPAYTVTGKHNSQQIQLCNTGVIALPTLLPCIANCINCAQLATLQSWNTIPIVGCAHNAAIGDPFLGQETIWTSTCSFLGSTVAQPTIPAGTPVVIDKSNIFIAADAEDTTPVADQEAVLSTLSSITTLDNTTDTTTPINTMPTTAPTSIPSTTSSAPTLATSFWAAISWCLVGLVARQ